METILFPAFQPETPAFKVGDIVSNFGQAGRILSVEENGDFILREVGGKMKWRAAAAKCSPVL